MAKNNPKNVASSIKKDVGEIDQALVQLSVTIQNINGGVDTLVPDAVALTDKSVRDKETQGLELAVGGKDSKNQSKSIQQTVEENIEKKYRAISYYTSGGMYKKLFMAKQNTYIAQEFPNLDKSLRLFTTDVCYGSYFSAQDDVTNRFVIRKDGVEVTDKNVVEAILNIINPPASKKEDINNRSFDDLDFEATYESRKDGYAFIRIIETKKVLTDLYVKYILKKAKSVTSSVQNTIVRANGTESLNMINEYLESVGYESSISSIDFNLNILPKNILDAIPEQLITVQDNNVNESKKSKQLDGFEDYEEFVYGNESFSEFAERTLSGKTSTMAIYRNTKEHENKRHVYRIGFESGSIDKDIAYDIYNSNILDGVIGNEIDLGLESSMTKFNMFDSNLLSKIKYEEIYSLNVDSVVSKIQNHIKDVVNYGIEKHVYNRNVSKPNLRLSPIDQLIKNVLIDDPKPMAGIEAEIMKSYSTFVEELNEEIDKNLEAGLEAIASNPVSYSDKIAQDEFMSRGRVSVSDITHEKMSATTNKVYKLFDHIKGCSSILLDNRRLIPIMMGNKNNGALYIEKTHAEIEHLIATRSVMSSPLAGSDNTMSLFQIDEERKEETLGRLIFSDTIKPIFERNMSTKFLRDNADLMYTVKELLEENEISKSDKSHGVFSDLGFFNLSKVSYISPSELVMYTNGDNLGVSMFEKAFVPANAYILARESYLSWILVDGKGVCFLLYPKGLNEVPGGYGASPLAELMEDIMCTRVSMKMGSTENMRLSKPIIPLPTGEGDADKIDIRDIDPPDFKIDQETVNRWQEEATGIVGYPASLFVDLNGGGSHPELARKMESLDASVVLDIVQAQDKKIHSSNSLATKLLHYRGGKEYSTYTVEWIPPRPARSNTNIKKEQVVEKKEVLDSYMDITETIMMGKDNYEVIKPFLTKTIASELFKDDKILNDIEGLYLKATNMSNADLASKAEEQ